LTKLESTSVECIHIKQHKVQKPKASVNFLKPKLNRKLQFVLQNWAKVIFCKPHTSLQ